MSDSEISIIVKNNRFILVHGKGSERRKLGIFRQKDLVPITRDESPTGECIGNLSASVDKVIAQIGRATSDEVGQTIVDLANRLLAFQALLGKNGPGESGILFDSLENALLVTYKKVKRMNDLAVKLQSTQ